MLVAFGLLAVLGMPLGLLVSGVSVVRAAVRSGLRIGVAVALVTLVTAVLSYATALAELEVAGRLDEARDCEKIQCALEESEAFDVTPVRSLGKYLFWAAVVEAAFLGWWEWRSSKDVGSALTTWPLTATVGLGALLSGYVGRTAWTLPLLATARADDLELRPHVQQGFLGMAACLLAIIAMVLATRLAPIRRPGPWGRVRVA